MYCSPDYVAIDLHLNPIVQFWLHHTAHCAEKIVYACKHAGSVSAQKIGQGEVGGVTRKVLCTWWLLACMERLRKRYSHLVGGSFLARKAAWALSGC